MKIQGYWNIYTCGFCGTEFAVSQLTDSGVKTSCPKCEDYVDVDFRNEDLIERAD